MLRVDICSYRYLDRRVIRLHAGPPFALIAVTPLSVRPPHPTLERRCRPLYDRPAPLPASTSRITSVLNHRKVSWAVRRPNREFALVRGMQVYFGRGVAVLGCQVEDAVGWLSVEA